MTTMSNDRKRIGNPLDGILGHVDLQWHSDPPDPDGDEGGEGGDPKDKPDPKDKDKPDPVVDKPDKDGNIHISQADLLALRKSSTDFENLLTVHNKMKSDNDKKREKERKQAGEFESLYTESKASVEELTPKVERLEKALGVYLETELTRLPKEFNVDLIPEGDVVDKLIWLSKAIKSGFVAVADAGNGDGTPAANQGNESDPWEDFYSEKTV